MEIIKRLNVRKTKGEKNQDLVELVYTHQLTIEEVQVKIRQLESALFNINLQIERATRQKPIIEAELVDLKEIIKEQK